MVVIWIAHLEASSESRKAMIAKLLLQIAVGAGGFVPVSAGFAGMMLGPAITGPEPASIDLDSHFRYLSGLLFGIGLAFWSTIPTIERRGQLFRILTAIVFIGGLARLYGIALHGWPGGPMIFGLIMELAVTPLLCIWQAALPKTDKA
jgi:hypothetical protein